MTIKKELKVGLLAVVSIALIVWGVNFLKGTNLLSKGQVYHAVYSKVDGLAGAEPVLINGLKVGQVRTVSFMPDMSGRIVVSFAMHSDFPFSKNTVARIISPDIMGSKALELDLKPGDLAEFGDTLPSDIQASLTEEVNRQVLPIKKKAEDLLTEVDSVITYIKVFFNQEARDYVAESFHNINSTFVKIDSLTASLDRVVRATETNMTSIAVSVDSVGLVARRNTRELNRMVDNLADISDSLANADLSQAVNNFANTLRETDSILSFVNTGEGNLGKLVYDSTLYENLEGATKELELLLEDMKLNPQRYVNFSLIGRKPEPYGPAKQP